MDDGKRSHTVVAHNEVITLILSKSDFQNSALYHWEVMEKNGRLDFMAALPFF